MPAYDYRCRSCDNRTSVTRSISDPEVSVSCGDCGGQTSRVWTAVAVGGVAGGSSSPAPAPVSAGGGGGCCGGGCCG